MKINDRTLGLIDECKETIHAQKWQGTLCPKSIVDSVELGKNRGRQPPNSINKC